MNFIKTAVMILTRMDVVVALSYSPDMVIGGSSEVLVLRKTKKRDPFQNLSKHCFNVKNIAEYNMGLIWVLHLWLCVAVVVAVVGVNTAESTVLIRFDRAPPAQSRFSTAVFRYSVIQQDGSSGCKDNGCSLHCKVTDILTIFSFCSVFKDSGGIVQ